MKLFYTWVVLGIAGIIASIILFVKHGSVLVLILNIAMCILTIAGVIRTTMNEEDQQSYQRSIAISFLSCIILGGYFNFLAFSSGGWGNFFSITLYAGIFCIPVLLFDKDSRETLSEGFGDAFREMFNFSGINESCLIQFIVGIFVLVLVVCLGVLLMIGSYIRATATLLSASVNANENVADLVFSCFDKIKSVNDSLTGKSQDETENSQTDSDDDWL